VHPPRNNEATCQLAVTDSEASRLVALCADQIGAAVKEAFCEIDSLSDAVLSVACHADALLAATRERNPKVTAASDPFEFASQALQESVRTASTRLQFADRLQQRLLNVAKNLANLARLMRSTELPISTTEWTRCLAATRVTFTMEQERQMFDAVFNASADGIHTGEVQHPEPVLFDVEVENES